MESEIGDRKRFALVSFGLPPAHSGQSMALGLLLKGVDPARYCLITQKNLDLYSRQSNFASPLPGRYYFLSPEYLLQRLLFKFDTYRHGPFFIQRLLRSRTEQISRILEQEDCRSVIACSGDLINPPAAFLASRNLGLPFYFYLFDHYSQAFPPGVQRTCANDFEDAMIKGADAVIVPNEFLGDRIAKAYGVIPEVVHNPCDIRQYEMTECPKKDRHGVNILYTGMVYEAHYDAFINIIAAIGMLHRQDITLDIYTPQIASKLKAKGISGPVSIHKSSPVSTMPEIQKCADILFLPLAFSTSYPEIIRTSSPGKMGEYLASGRPIIVHAPEDSYISWYFHSNNCGIVVDRISPEDLAKAINTALLDESLKNEMIENAKKCAVRDFGVDANREKFFRIIEGPSRQGTGPSAQ